MLYLIGIGLGDEKDLTINALEVIKKCDLIYLENYTSNISFDIQGLEKLAGKDVFLADRYLVENSNEIIDKAKNNNVAFLVKGDVFSATTHTDLFLRAEKSNVKCRTLHNASILTAVGDTGLSLYKFGKVASIPFDNEDIDSAYKIFLENKDMHTLFLLDLKPNESNYMDFKYGLAYLIKKGLKDDVRCVVCAGLGTNKSVIKYGKVKDLFNVDIIIYPQCIIIPGKLHFMEEEILNKFL